MRTSKATRSSSNSRPHVSLCVEAARRGEREVMEVLLQFGGTVDEQVVGEAVTLGNSHLLPLLINAQWYQMASTGQLHFQALLDSLDFESRFGVREEFLRIVSEKPARALTLAFIQSFRMQPFEAFSDAVRYSDSNQRPVCLPSPVCPPPAT